jgi:co-chaperonin GroES (HSP10)
VSVGVHAFQIPHEHVQPMRDMVIVRLPMPPTKIGSILTSDLTRDMMQHNVMAGKVFAMGPLAFKYKDGENGLGRQDVQVGDWVLFRPFAGTMIQGGKLVATSGWRYVSSFNDIIGTVKASDWDPVCEWDYADDAEPAPVPQADFNFDSRKEVA